MDLLNPSRLTALLVAVSFAAGLNLYITVAALGLLAHYGVMQLPPGLSLLDQPWVIGVAVGLAVVEAVADKIPYFDLVWNALHTFIRIPAAALLAYQASNRLSPGEQLLVTTVAAVVAGASHMAKTSARVAVSASPEPVSNAVLSTSEDVAAAGITWLATVHPYVSAAVVGAALLVIVVLVRQVVRGVHAVMRRLQNRQPGGAAPVQSGVSPDRALRP